MKYTHPGVPVPLDDVFPIDIVSCEFKIVLDCSVTDSRPSSFKLLNFQSFDYKASKTELPSTTFFKYVRNWYIVCF